MDYKFNTSSLDDSSHAYSCDKNDAAVKKAS